MIGIRKMLWRRGFGVLVGAVLGSFTFAGAASAAGTCNVTDQRDLAQQTVGLPGSMGGASDYTLRSCIAWANQTGGATTINLPAGTYPITSSSVTPGDLARGDFKVNPANNGTAITLVGAGMNATIINAEGHDRVLTLYPNGSLTMTGMTLENGTGEDPSAFPAFGGAIDSAGHLVVSGVAFTGNTALGDGGAIAAQDSPGSTLSVAGSVFQGNVASGVGGAIYSLAPNDASVTFSLLQDNAASGVGGGIAALGTAAGLTLNYVEFLQNAAAVGGGVFWYGRGALNVANSLFNQNGAIGGVGGGLMNEAPVNLNISNTSFDGNSSHSGGAGVFDDASNLANFTEDKFTNNNTPAGAGGGLLLDSTGVTTLKSSELDANSGEVGGAISWLGGALSVLGSSFVLNHATDGAGLYEDSVGLLTMVDSTLSRNTATAAGGGLFFAGIASIPSTLTNDTVAFNNAAAGLGGGIFGAGELKSGGSATSGFGVQNTLVAENSGGDCSAALGKLLVLTDVGHNLDGDGSCLGGLSVFGDLPQGNASLLDPANNGGPVAGGPGDTETLQTDAEQGASQSVNAGQNAGCPATDERGGARPVGSACDIGAYELGANPVSPQPSPSSVTTSTSTTTKTSSSASTTSTTTQTTHTVVTVVTKTMTSSRTSTSSTRPGHHPAKCKKGHHRSKHGKCVANKK